MNSLKQHVNVLLAFVVAVVSAYLFGDVSIEGVSMAALMPTGFSDPDRLRRWSQNYFKRVQSKVIFGERYTGTKIADDGPKKTDLMTAEPIVEVNDLKNRKGTRINFTLMEPLFPDSQSRLNYTRIKGQKREDSEKSGGKKFVDLALGTGFWGVKEEDITIGKQEIGLGDLYGRMVELLSDNTAAYMDDDLVETFFLGQSRHLYQTVAKTTSMSDGDKPTGNAEAAIKDPAEHPNTYLYYYGNGTGVLEKADSNSVEDVHSLLTKANSDVTASAKLMNKIALECKKQKIIPTTYRGGDMGNRSFYRVIMDPIMMQQFRDDIQDNDAVNSAYQASGAEHPYLSHGDVIWGPLHITEEEKLLDDAFSVENNYGADEYDSDSGGGDGVTEVTASQIKRTTDSDGIESIYIEHGSREFKTGTNAGDDSNIGPDGADNLGNIMVLGANSLAKCPGPVLPLIERTDDDYNRILGLGSEHLFGCKRLDFVDKNGDFSFNQSSLRIVTYRGS